MADTYRWNPETDAELLESLRRVYSRRFREQCRIAKRRGYGKMAVLRVDERLAERLLGRAVPPGWVECEL